jgi:hypothetical protein
MAALFFYNLFIGLRVKRCYNYTLIQRSVRGMTSQKIPEKAGDGGRSRR